MPIVINGYELSDDEVAAELDEHQDASNPLYSATTALILRRVLLDEAQRLQLDGDDDMARIDRLLELQTAQLPVPDAATCRRHYDGHLQQFTVGELVEVDHILFQVTQQAPLDALRNVAEQTLATVLDDPAQFASCARALSNCPSASVGGNLGQFGRGDSVPEFERVVFAMSPGQILPRLLETRFGLHIVRLVRRIDGRLQPFEQVAERIATALHQASCGMECRQYLHRLVAGARIEGIDLDVLSGPLQQ